MLPDRQTEEQREVQTDTHTDKQTDRQTNRQINIQKDKTDRHTPAFINTCEVLFTPPV